MNYQTIFGAIIRKDTLIYFLADSSDDIDMMCCIYKRRMYTCRFKEINRGNQMVYESIVQELAELNKRRRHRSYKKFIQSFMVRDDNSEVRRMIENMDPNNLGEVILESDVSTSEKKNQYFSILNK